jgi:hypothetical protein
MKNMIILVFLSMIHLRPKLKIFTSQELAKLHILSKLEVATLSFGDVNSVPRWCDVLELPSL